MKVHTLLLAIAAVMAIAFAACGDDDDKSSATATAAPTRNTQATATPTPSPPATFFDCGATQPPTPADSSAFPVTLTDSSGRAVTIEKAPTKIASMDAAHTEVLFAIGAGAQVTAVDNTSDCPASVGTLPKLDAFTPSLEAITAQQPDLVLLAYDTGDLAANLTAAGIDVIVQPFPATVAAIYDDIELVGKATGHVDTADELVTNMSARVHDIEQSVAGKTPVTVFHELDNTYFSVGEGSFVDDFYTILGAKNIGHDTGSSSPQLSSEAIIAANPDVIVLADEEFGESAETVAARPGWSAINAVKNNRICGLDPDIVSREGPRIVDALNLLKLCLYP